ncbi:hypothetical protein BDP27DRAFT_1423328 [Rhodocollybia butyracea]|uniref:Uncharacterized protein n=1 Tax=Rhodocollybia butyracea TaxID=206335 RepID=A0A9P5U6N7_9AGAR|nr:hypothetical protein BDP27DRAFT_1423328 [Rhodocollybia butyracea]
MATITRTREEMEELSTQPISYPVHMITPDSRMIRQVTSQPTQTQVTDNTPLYFPERGRHLGRNSRNRSVSLSPTRLRATRLSTFGNMEAPANPELSYHHQYYTRESAGMPIRPEPHQIDLQTELQNQTDTSGYRSTASPHLVEQQLLADLEEHIQASPRTPTRMPTQRVSPTFQTPSTPSVFNEVLNHPELLVPDDRASEEVLYLQEHASMNQSMVGRGPFRENFTFSNTPAAQSTPRNTGNQPQSYSDQYRSIMGESPGTHNNSSPMREPLSVTHSDFPELRDRTEYQRSRAQLHATAQLVRNLLVRLGIENQTDRTAVGWLRVLETLATTPLSEMPLNLANNIREPRNASLLNHYVRVIRDQPYRNIVENNDWLSTIPNSSPGSSPNQENPRQRILRL